MFNELTKMFGGSSKKERRHSPRHKRRFVISWIRNAQEMVPGVGMEMSLNGLLFATREAPPAPTFDVIMDLDGRRLRCRLNTARSGTITREGKTWTLLGCSFTGIAADDYDKLVRYLKNINEPDNKAAKDLAALDKTDDAYRMLPMVVQRRVLESLVRLGRLQMPDGVRQPLLRMQSLGMQAGRQRLAVHSRVAGNDAMRAFDSVIAIDEHGGVKVES